MKLTQSITSLNTKDLQKLVSKKITLANTSTKLGASKEALSKSVASASEPIFFTNSANLNFNPDIRFQNNYGFSPLTGINFRNDLLMFAENSEIKKAIKIIANEIIVTQMKSNKYPVFPVINLTQISEDKQEVASAIQKYLDEVFYPKLYQMLGLKKKGLSKIIKEYLTTGKIAFEIIYDNIKNPKDIIGIIPIDPATLQKFKKDDNVWYIQKPIMDSSSERILHENQVILIEWNEYDFGFVSYADKLRRPFNIMRSMQTSKVLWFATKSQVRMHIKLALGDMTRIDATDKLKNAREKFTNQYSFNDSTGEVKFNNAPLNSGYREFFTAETANSGSPEIEEVNTNGPDLTEVDSLNWWQRSYWLETEIPYDRIDPNSSDSWGFTDVASLRKIEVNFSKFIEDIREQLNEMFLKPIIIQLTLQELEIGIDLSLLDTIEIDWQAFNQYDKLGELEIINKKVEIATNMVAFGELEDVNGKVRKMMPVTWVADNYLDFTPEQKQAMELARRKENVMLGFAPDGTEPEEETVEETVEEELSEETAEDIAGFDDSDFG